MKTKVAVLNLVGWMIEKIWPLFPAKPDYAFVFGSPSSEGNSFVVARALLQQTNMHVTWINPPSQDLLRAQGIFGSARLETLESEWALKSLRRYLVSKYIFTTTELFGMPSPPPTRTVVNLWHGDGIKGGKFFPFRTLKGPSSTYLVGATKLLQVSRAQDAGVDPSAVLLTGMPRADLFLEPADDNSLRMLGLSPTKPFILFMPTFRRAKTKKGNLAWSDTDKGYSPRHFEEMFSDTTVQSLSNAGIDVVVKLHYLDFDEIRIPGLKTITDIGINSAGTTLYGLLARSAGLITDYSSVWIDYLHLDKPIAFYSPDEETYWKHRPKDLNFQKVPLPGVEINSEMELISFANDILGARDIHQSTRDQARKSLGLISNKSNTIELLKAVSIIQF